MLGSSDSVCFVPLYRFFHSTVLVPLSIVSVLLSFSSPLSWFLLLECSFDGVNVTIPCLGSFYWNVPFDGVDVTIPCLGASPFFSLFSSPLLLCCVNCSSPFYIACPPFFSLLLLLPLLLCWLFFLLISSPYVGFIWYVVLDMLLDCMCPGLYLKYLRRGGFG
jgi:hypothetical protein